METQPEPRWTPERIQKLIDDKIEEGPQVEYKGAAALARIDSKKVEMTKDVSAFANAAGGTIVYGIREFDDDARKHLPERIDPVDGRDFSKEWLDQILGQISPRIDNLTITPVRVGPEPHHSCYVVEIPKSLTAHQARDLRYYKRSNFESVAMADYEIRDVMNRRRHPQLEFKARIFATGHMTTKVAVRVWNKGTVIAKNYKLRLLLPPLLNGVKLDGAKLPIQDELGMKFLRFSLGNPMSPIFPNDDVILDCEVAHLLPFQSVPQPTAENMICVLYADEMPFIRRDISVSAASLDWA